VTFPVLIRLGPLTRYPHWLFETLGYTLAGCPYARDRRRDGDVISKHARWWVIGAAALVGTLRRGRLLCGAIAAGTLNRRPVPRSADQ
jgi:hypothetical protein